MKKIKLKFKNAFSKFLKINKQKYNQNYYVKFYVTVKFLLGLLENVYGK